MATKNKIIKQRPIAMNDMPEVSGKQTHAHSYDVLPQMYSGFLLQSIFLGVLCLIFYGNTFSNGPAFDDNSVIVQNDYVHQGFAGIPKILTSDAYESVGNNQNADGGQLSGGRYRPLSIVTFAIEQQLMETDSPDDPEVQQQSAEAKKAKADKLNSQMHARHVANVLLYIVSVVVLLYFLRKIVFPGNPMPAFFAALIFAIHPLHTEVVANVKSRDEILSLLFICLTLITAFKYNATRKAADLLTSLVCFFFALLSKEYAVVIIVLLPLSFYCFNSYGLAKSTKSSLIYLLPLVLYFILRVSSVKGISGTAEADVMNNPYLRATAMQKIATIIYVPINYIKLLIFPHPLAADYNFNQIPYTTFADYRVWLSVVVHAGLLVLMVFSFKKRKVLGFALALYFAFLALVSNVFFNIGSPMGERLIYHSSVGFAIIVGFLLHRGYEKMGGSMAARVCLGALLIVLTGLSGFKVITRNLDWKSDDALFTKDVKTVPNSVIANNNAGFVYIKRSGNYEGAGKEEMLRTALPLLNKAIALNGKFVLAYLNRGICYFRLGEIEKAYADCDTVTKYYPLLPALKALSGPLTAYFSNQGIKYGTDNNDSMALYFFKKAADVAPFDPRILCNLGMQYVKARRYKEARPILMHVLQLKPDDEQALGLLQIMDSGN